MARKKKTRWTHRKKTKNSRATPTPLEAAQAWDSLTNDVTSARKGVIGEIFKPARKKFKRMKVTVKGLWETLSADLVDMRKYADENDGYQHILTCMDNFSKWAWAVPVLNKSGPTITEAMRTILMEKKRPIKFIHVDQGTEFFNSDFQKLMSEYGIKLYHTFSVLKCPMIERLVFRIRIKIRNILLFFFLRFQVQPNFKANDAQGILYSRQ